MYEEPEDIEEVVDVFNLSLISSKFAEEKLKHF
jgi:hypothetical protein